MKDEFYIFLKRNKCMGEEKSLAVENYQLWNFIPSQGKMHL